MSTLADPTEYGGMTGQLAASRIRNGRTRGFSSAHLVIFAVSAAALLFQVAQTRLFSATLGYHLSYMVISVALLGVGAGATLSALIDGRPRRPSTSALASAVGLACLVSLFLQTRIDPDGAGLAVAVVAAYVLGALPFAFASWVVVRCLREDPRRSGSLYGADLAGAAVGSVLAFLALPYVGVPALYGIAAVLGVGGAAIAEVRAPLARGALLVAAISIPALALFPETLAPSQTSHIKVPIVGPGIEHLATRWDPHARVDVLGYRGGRVGASYDFLVSDSYAAERPDSLTMVLDLGVVTPVVSGDGHEEVLAATIIAAPYAILDQPAVLVIGPGGGIDVQTALVHGARRVDAVEVNRAVVAVMRRELLAYSGGVYEDPRVRVYEDEARSFIRRSSESYDLIALTVVDSYTALASGAYAVSESYLYTAEAIRDEMRHLTSDGVLALGRWYLDPPIEMIRIAQLAASALREEGAANPEHHMMVLRHRNFGLLLVRARPFEAQAVAAVHQFADLNGFAVSFDALAPSAPFAGVLDVPPPTTDDRPFFFANEGMEMSGEGMIAYTILYVTLAPALILSYLVLLRPVLRLWKEPPGRRALVPSVQAIGVGFGFIAAEIILLQRLTLFLGLPAMAIAVGLAALLLGAAAGAALSVRLQVGIAGAALASAALVVAGIAAMGWISDVALAAPLPVRIALAGAATGLVGLPLGAVLPQILRRAAAQDDLLIPWIWALNGAASVVGSIVSVALAMAFGFTTLALLAAGCYALVAAAERVRSGVASAS